MYPAFMDSYPPNMNQRHSTPHHHHQHYPGHYQSWPHSGYGCPDFNYYPGYFAPRPPYTTSPPLFYHGCYPVPPVSYPVCYNCSPHYAMEVPPYNRHPGDMSGYYGHCCGCPNQSYYKRKEGNNVKIEEEGSDSGNRADDPAASLDFNSHPYPVVWIPPGFMKNTADVSSNESELAEKKYNRGAAKANEGSKSSEEQKSLLNRWLPLIVDNSRSAKQGDDLSREQEHQDEDMRKFGKGCLPLIMDNSGFAKQGGDSARKLEQQDEDKRQFPFPFIWMPYNLDDSVKKKDNEKTNLGEERVKENPKVLVFDAEDKNNAPEVNEFKAVPVKSAESTEESKIPKNNEEKMESSSIMHVNGIEEAKSPQGCSTKSKPSSSVKSPKLPPICLRVDQPRKKKNAKSGSRSPSPPGNKEKLHESTRDLFQPLAVELNGKEAAEQGMTSGKCVQEPAKDAGQRERKVKTIEVLEGTTRNYEIKDPNLAHSHGIGSDSLSLESHVEMDERATNKSEGASPDVTAQKANLATSSESNRDQATGVRQSIDGIDSSPVDMDGEIIKVDQSPANKVKENVRILSEDEAATIIQSVYRGYEVRRWEPLIKLKQIACVRDEVVKLRDRFSSDTQNDDKWRIAVEETIMNLLLKLDTIQGLHPSIKDVRKSLARELVSLQEKIDCLIHKKSEMVHELDSGDKFDKDQGGQGQEEVLKESKPAITDIDHEVYPEFCQGMASTGVGNHLEIPNMVTGDENTGATLEQPVTESLGSSTTEASETGFKFENEVRNASADLATSDDQGHSSDVSLSQVGNDADTGASPLETLAETLGASAVETNETGSDTENEATNALNCLVMNGDQGNFTEFSLAQGRGDEDTIANSLEAVAESLEASTIDKHESGLQSENKATIASEDLAMDGGQGYSTVLSHPQGCGEIVHAGDDASSVMNELFNPKEVAESPEGPNAELQNNYLPQCEAGNDKSQEVPDNGDDDSGKDAFFQRNGGNVLSNEASMNFNAKRSNDEVLDADQAEEAQEVKVTAPNSSEMNDSWVSPPENVDNIVEHYTKMEFGSHEIPVRTPEEKTSFISKLRDDSEENVDNSMENSIKVDFGSHEIPVEAPEEKTSFMSKLGDDTEVHDQVSVEMEAEALVASNEAQSASQQESALSHVKSCKDKTALISESDSHVAVNNCCGLENDQKLLNKMIDIQVSESAAKDDRLMVHPSDSVDLEKDSVYQIEQNGKDTKEGELSPQSQSSPTDSQSTIGNDGSTEFYRKLIEENEKLREIMQKLIEAGNEQLAAISNLSGRVKDLEKKLRKNKLKMRGHSTTRYASRKSCMKPSNGFSNEKVMPLAM